MWPVIGLYRTQAKMVAGCPLALSWRALIFQLDYKHLAGREHFSFKASFIPLRTHAGYKEGLKAGFVN